MNDKQENFFSMCKRVEARLDANQALIATIPALETARLSFKSQIGNIRATDIIATTTLTGVAQDKKNTRLTLVSVCIQYAGSLCAYAANNNNNTLYDEVYKPESETERLRDDQLPTYALLILSRLNTHIGSLADYGIDPGTIVNFQNLIDAYTSISQSPRTAISSRKAAVASLKVQFRNINNFLKKVLDKLVITLKPTAPIFVEEYFNDRIIYDDGGASNTLTIYQGTLTPSQALVLGSIPANTKNIRMEVTQVGSVEFGLTNDGINFFGNTRTVNGIGSSTLSVGFFGTPAATTQFLAKNLSPSNPAQYKVTMLS